MAIGLGKMFGFDFPENFNYPYISRSVTEFWRRWHISLSTWFKEYVYIPLGGNRKGMARQILNISIVWALTGFWHGASWNFLLWGLYYAVLLIFEKTFWLKLLQKLPRFVGHIYTVFVFVMGWVLFYFTDFGQLGAFLVRLFAGVPMQNFTGNLILGFLPLTAVAIFASTPAMKRLQEKYAEKEELFGENIREVERVILLRTVDRKWMDHIDDMDQLRQGANLVSYGQKDPLVEYKMAGYDMFDAMTANIKEDTVRLLLRVKVEQRVEREEVAKVTGTNKDDSAKTPVVKKETKVYPNDPCPCGSGKKYKQCCGRNS